MRETNVAPRAGAWIETGYLVSLTAIKWVAPRAGAWIETNTLIILAGAFSESRPVRARGLKLLNSIAHFSCLVSRPVRARGLKQL